MEAEESLIHLLQLFDSFWFENQIFNKNSNQLFVSKVEDDCDQPKLARISTRDDQNDDKTILLRTSQESLSSGDSDNLLSPNSVLMRTSPAKLETILSEKELPEEKKEEKKLINSSKKISTTRRRRRRRKGKGRVSSKSLSELEFQEVKGFMDLGFVFSEGDKNSSLVKIIPGLQRFGGDKEKQEDSVHNNAGESLIRRPYLSQAWEVMEYGRKKPAAEKKLKWKINAAVLDNDMDMKNQLKFWAQSVASAVK